MFWEFPSFVALSNRIANFQLKFHKIYQSLNSWKASTPRSGSFIVFFKRAEMIMLLRFIKSTEWCLLSSGSLYFNTFFLQIVWNCIMSLNKPFHNNAWKAYSMSVLLYKCVVTGFYRTRKNNNKDFQLTLRECRKSCEHTYYSHLFN